jgi:hypothetical protein
MTLTRFAAMLAASVVLLATGGGQAMASQGSGRRWKRRRGRQHDACTPPGTDPTSRRSPALASSDSSAQRKPP